MHEVALCISSTTKGNNQSFWKNSAVQKKTWKDRLRNGLSAGAVALLTDIDTWLVIIPIGETNKQPRKRSSSWIFESPYNSKICPGTLQTGILQTGTLQVNPLFQDTQPWESTGEWNIWQIVAFLNKTITTNRFQASPRSLPRGGGYVEPRWVKELGGASSTETGMLWPSTLALMDKPLWQIRFQGEECLVPKRSVPPMQCDLFYRACVQKQDFQSTFKSFSHSPMATIFLLFKPETMFFTMCQICVINLFIQFLKDLNFLIKSMQYISVARPWWPMSRCIQYLLVLHCWLIWQMRSSSVSAKLLSGTTSHNVSQIPGFPP